MKVDLVVQERGECGSVTIAAGPMNLLEVWMESSSIGIKVR